MQVMRQSIAFLHKTTMLVSDHNPGGGLLAQEMISRYPELHSQPLRNFAEAALRALRVDNVALGACANLLPAD